VRGYNYNVLAGNSVTLLQLAQGFEEVKDDLTKLRTWTNTKLGLPWDDSHTFQGAGQYDQRLEDYTEATVPSAVLFVTCGIDLQKDRCEASYWGFGLNGQIWSLGFDVIDGGANDQGFRNLHEHLLGKQFTNDCGQPVYIDKIGLDSSAFTKDAYKFCKESREVSKGILTYFPMKGSSNGEKVPIFPLKRGNRDVYIVGGHQAKDKIYDLLKIRNNEIEGYIHFSRQLTNDNFFDQLHSERKILIEKAGRYSYRYEPINLNKVRNEQLDCFVYAYATFEGVSPNLQAIYNARQVKAKLALKEDLNEMLNDHDLIKEAA
jgi:phage terminase large subunit GpA-like protein